MNDNPTPSFHRIRLHGPWKANVVEGSDHTGQKPNAKTVLKIPCDWGQWLGQTFFGRVLLVRTFGKPTELFPDQPVWLNVLAVDSHAEIRLNQMVLGRIMGDRPFRCRIDHLLNAGNRLEIEIVKESLVVENAMVPSQPGSPGGLIGSVFLEIEE